MLVIYLLLCVVLCFLPIESYTARLFSSSSTLKKTPATKGAIFVWKPWLTCLTGVLFFAKGLLLGLVGNIFLADFPLLIFLGFILALLSEAYSPLKKNRHILVLGLGFLTIYQLPAVFIYGLIFIVLAICLRYRVPALIAAAGIYALTLIPAGNSYQLAAALVLFILICVYYLEQLRDYFDGNTKNILEELKSQ
jgi:hypothetical protein